MVVHRRRGSLAYISKDLKGFLCDSPYPELLMGNQWNDCRMCVWQNSSTDLWSPLCFAPPRCLGISSHPKSLPSDALLSLLQRSYFTLLLLYTDTSWPISELPANSASMPSFPFALLIKLPAFKIVQNLLKGKSPHTYPVL